MVIKTENRPVPENFAQKKQNSKIVRNAADARRAISEIERKPTMKEPMPWEKEDDAPPAKPDISKAAETPVEKRPYRKIPSAVRKVPIHIYLSPQVVEFFRATGRDWQPRLNEVLVAYVETHRKELK